MRRDDPFYAQIWVQLTSAQQKALLALVANEGTGLFGRAVPGKYDVPAGTMRTALESLVRTGVALQDESGGTIHYRLADPFFAKWLALFTVLVGNSEVKTAAATIDLDLLESGTNEVTFETGSSITDGISYPYRVDALSITVSYGTPEPAIVADPTSLNFGSVVVGETATISNAGSSELTVTDLAVSGTFEAAFSLAADAPTSITLDPGASQSVDVVFEPGTEGDAEAVLTIASDDPDTPTLNVALSGTGDDGANPLPETFSLEGNYPNPFNPATTVTFNLPEDAEIGLAVYDVLGRLAMRVSSREMKAGSAREINVDAGSLVSGTYVYRVIMRTGRAARTITGRMTLLK